MLKTAKTYPLTVVAVAAALMTYAAFIMSILAASMNAGNILAVIGASIAACVTWDIELTLTKEENDED